jgi:hypothetical protein
VRFVPRLTQWFGVTERDCERNLGTEPACIDAIRNKVLTMQANAATKQHRPLCRGTHAKGITARAQFEVFHLSAGHEPALAKRLAQGMFASPGIYPAIVRFANSDSCRNSDFKADVRALSISVDLTCHGTTARLPGAERQDFTLQSAETLPLNDAPAFLATMKVITASSASKALWSLPFLDKLRALRAISLGELQAHQPVRPYQTLRYWSTVPFRHGCDDVVKQSAIPSAANRALPLQKNNSDALIDELERHLDNDDTMSSFDFALQFLDTERMTYWRKRRDAHFWIENASVVWKETEAPFHTVARLTLLPRSRLSPAASEQIYFDVNGHSTPESRPIGSINRARWSSEVASRNARLKTGI